MNREHYACISYIKLCHAGNLRVVLFKKFLNYNFLPKALFLMHHMSRRGCIASLLCHCQLHRTVLSWVIGPLIFFIIPSIVLQEGTKGHIAAGFSANKRRNPQLLFLLCTIHFRADQVTVSHLPADSPSGCVPPFSDLSKSCHPWLSYSFYCTWNKKSFQVRYIPMCLRQVTLKHSVL